MKGKKGFDAKAFLANHVEKLGFGLIALTVVGIWASEFFGGSWSRERRNPDALIQQIEAKKREIDAGIWPADKQAEFATVDFSERAMLLSRPINTSRYDLTTELFVPLYRPKEKAREPELVAVESLMAMPGHVILALISEEDKLYGEDADPMAQVDEPEEEEGDEFTRRDSRAAVPRGGPLGAFGDKDEDRPAGPVRPGQGRFDRKIMAIGPGALPTGGAALIGQEESDKNVRGKKKRRGLSGQAPAGRFYVAVRGVWPIKQQLEKIRKALHLPTPSAAMEHLELLDFELERQVAVKGDNPWSKDWEKIDVSRAMEILKEVDGFDDEPVDMEVFDPVITMPLPMRAFGVWTDQATHPRIKNYLLTPEGKEREKALMARFLEEREKMRVEEEKLRGRPKGGFASQVNDFRSMATQMNRMDPRGMRSMMTNLSKDLRNSLNMGGDLTPEQLSAKITAVGQLLLFRYFDFDVLPGYAYRYRVRLVLRNPNYERPVTEVVDPSVAEGMDRVTPYSNTSNVAVLPMSPRYFLRDVDRHPLAGEGRHKTVATVSMFEMHKEFGTRVTSTLELKALGQFIGGVKEVEVLDVSVPEIDDQEYPFTSEDVLIDVRPDVELQPELHPDLPLPTAKKKTVEVGLVPDAIVINRGGELKLLESGKDRAEEKRLKSLLESERKPFEGLKKSSDQANPLDAMPFGRAAMDDEDRPFGLGNRGARGKGKRGEDGTSNPRRKVGRAAFAAGPGAAGLGAAGMRPGGGRANGPGGGPPAGGKGGKRGKGGGTAY